jgi:TRAP-type C4-dicarboxylate transport system permease small subunit
VTIFDRGCQAVTAIALVIALISMAAQIISRYVIGSSLVWSEELARYALIWSAMVGSAVAYREGNHIGITLLVDLCPEVIRKLVFRLVHAMVLLFAGIVAWHGWFLALRNFERHQLSAALQIDIAWAYMAIPVGAGLIMMAAVGALWKGTKPTRIREDD